MRSLTKRFAAAALTVLVGACATLPAGPAVTVLPGSRKNFDEFRVDDAACRDYAYRSVGGQTPQDAATNSAVASAVIGTAIGAAAGAALGGGQGAAVGAGTGLLFGSAVGSSNAYASGYGVQERYDGAYTQCMYARGNRVPVSASYVAAQRPVAQVPAPGAAPAVLPNPPPAARSNGQPPPPPAGLPPAPPPR